MKTCHIANRAGSALASARPSALRSIAGLALTLSIVPGTALAQEKGAQPARTAEAVLPTQIQTALHIVQQDLAIAELLQALRGPAPRGLLAVRDVRVIDPITETVSANQSVIVDGDRIAWTGDLAKEPKAASINKGSN